MVLVTGATGRIGNVLVKELIKKGESVKVLVRKSSNVKPLENLGCEFVYGDLMDLQSIEDHVEGISTIFHLAGNINISAHNKNLTFDTNIGGTKNIVDICLKKNISLVYTSSVHAFDAPIDGSVVTEDTPLSLDQKKSRGLYDYSKGGATQYVRVNIKNGLKAIVVHPSGVTGPFDYKPSFFGAGMIELVKSGVDRTVDGQYDYVDVRDVVSGILKAYDLKKYGESYILSNEILNMKDYTTILRDILGIKKETVLLPYSVSLFLGTVFSFFNYKSQITPYSVKTLSSNCNFSHEKASKELGYTPGSVKESILDQYSWFKDHGYLD